MDYPWNDSKMRTLFKIDPKGASSKTKCFNQYLPYNYLHKYFIYPFLTTYLYVLVHLLVYLSHMKNLTIFRNAECVEILLLLLLLFLLKWRAVFCFCRYAVRPCLRAIQPQGASVYRPAHSQTLRWME